LNQLQTQQENIMKKFAISLIALAAISTASFASFRDITTPYGAVDTEKAGSVSASNAFAVPVTSRGMSGDVLGLGGSNRR
jgi:hypothetical protein